MSRRSAFTLLEVLVSIGVVLILLSLIAPSLVRLRTRATETRALSDLRQHAAVFTMYTGDWNDRFPAFADRHATQTVLRTSHGTVAFRYFNSFNFWPFAMSDLYYSGASPSSELFLSPTGLEDAYTPYIYSCSLIARPDYWDPTTRGGRDQLGATTLSQVRFPASKGLLSTDLWRAGISPGVLVDQGDSSRQMAAVATVAGSARSVLIDELGDTVRTGDGAPGSGRPTGEFGGHQIGWTPTAAHTFRGVEGRDLPP